MALALFLIWQSVGSPVFADDSCLRAAAALGHLEDPTFLVQSLYGYRHDPDFLVPMREAIRARVVDLKHGLHQGHYFTADDVKDGMKAIGLVRREIARKAGASNPYNYGAPYVGRTVDNVSKGEGRHAALFERVRKVAEARDGATPTIKIDGVTVRLSTLQAVHGDHDEIVHVAVIHPKPADAERLQKKAFEIFAHVLNSESMTETEALDQMAKAYFMLMHGTPFVLGSPSIVESYMESILQAKFHKSFPKTKIDEPFWKVILWDVDKGEFKGKDLLACWKS